MSENKRPQISVIVPVYNVEKYLPKCIDSILAQTYTDFELLLIDDGSPDRSGAVCDEYAARDPRIRVFHKPNGGASSARNLGLDNARGEWITFIDGDDLIAPDYLERLYKETTIYPNADLIQSGIINLYENGDTRIEQEYHDNISDDSSFMFSNVRGLLHGKLFNRDIISRNKVAFNEKLKLCEDIVFTTQYLIYANTVKFSSYNGYYYRRHSASATGGKILYVYNDRYETTESIAKLYREYCSTKKIPIPDKHKKTIANNYWSLIISLYKTRVEKGIRLKVLRQIVRDVDKNYLALLDLSGPQKAYLKILFKNSRLFDSLMVLSVMGYRLLKN